MTFLQALGLTVFVPLVLISAAAIATEKSDSLIADIVWVFGGTAAIVAIVNNLLA